MLADGGARAGVVFPQPSPDVAGRMAAQLPPIATVSNPLDYTTPLWGHEAPLTALFTDMFRDQYDAAIMVQDYPTSHPGESYAPYLADVRAFVAATRAAGMEMMPVFYAAALTPKFQRTLSAMRLPSYGIFFAGTNQVGILGAATREDYYHFGLSQWDPLGEQRHDRRSRP